MNNVAMKLNGKKLTIEVDLSVKGTPSSTGKTLLVASTGGNVKIDGAPEFSIGLNVTTKPKP